jgi:hypothetical protein
VRGDKSGSRGQDGSPSDRDGLGILSRSAPASARDILKDKLECAPGSLKADDDSSLHGLSLNHAIREAFMDCR